MVFCCLRSKWYEPWDANKIVGDEVEQEVACDAVKAAMPGLRMVPCCLPQPKMHSIIARRDWEAA